MLGCGGGGVNRSVEKCVGEVWGSVFGVWGEVWEVY